MKDGVCLKVVYRNIFRMTIFQKYNCCCICPSRIYIRNKSGCYHDCAYTLNLIRTSLNDIKINSSRKLYSYIAYHCNNSMHDYIFCFRYQIQNKKSFSNWLIVFVSLMHSIIIRCRSSFFN